MRQITNKPLLLAILKDAWTVHILLESIQSGFDFARGKQTTDEKTRAKYVIFLAAFVFEDIGQVLIQEFVSTKSFNFSEN